MQNFCHQTEIENTPWRIRIFLHMSHANCTRKLKNVANQSILGNRTKTSCRGYSSSPRRHHTGLSELTGKKQQQPTIYNLVWRDTHARTTQESYLARAMREPRRERQAPSQPTGSYNRSYFEVHIYTHNLELLNLSLYWA